MLGKNSWKENRNSKRTKKREKRSINSLNYDFYTIIIDRKLKFGLVDTYILIIKSESRKVLMTMPVQTIVVCESIVGERHVRPNGKHLQTYDSYMISST